MQDSSYDRDGTRLYPCQDWASAVPALFLLSPRSVSSARQRFGTYTDSYSHHDRFCLFIVFHQSLSVLDVDVAIQVRDVPERVSPSSSEADASSDCVDSLRL